MEVFLNTGITNTTELNMANFQDIYSGIIKDRGSSALWFYPAAVSHHLLLRFSFADDL
jgi:Ran GTPase-activating protein (RanGAP) involved in mRNA processing and transport